MTRRLYGPLLMVTGALDVLYVVAFRSRQPAAIAQDGFFDAIGPNVAHVTFDRETTTSWHLAFGLTATILDGLIHRERARTGTLPVFPGWCFWIVLPQAVIGILMARRTRADRVKETEGVRRAAG